MREKLRLPLTPIQTVGNTASEVLKSKKNEKENEGKSLTVRYDIKTFKFYPDSHTISH